VVFLSQIQPSDILSLPTLPFLLARLGIAGWQRKSQDLIAVGLLEFCFGKIAKASAK
jgi:hypothetical protein